MKQLLKGVRIDKGYVQVRIMYKSRYYCKNFGPDDDLGRELANLHLLEKKRDIRQGIDIFVPKETRKRFSDAAEIWFAKWSAATDPDGAPKHNPASVRGVRLFLDGRFIPYFGRMWYDEIKAKDVQAWRDSRLQTVLGTSADREMVVLSAMFSDLTKWMSTEQIKPFKMPANYCVGVETSPTRKRERVLTINELKALKGACYAANDADLWEICTVALKSLLRKKDLFDLEAGIDINTKQAKTGRSIQLPVTVLRSLNCANFRKRWESARRAARLEFRTGTGTSAPIDQEKTPQLRDLRKTGANLLKMKNHSTQLISEFLGHSNTDTTEIYMIENAEHLRPLANDLDAIVSAL